MVVVKVDLLELHETGNPEELARKIHEWNPDLALPIPVNDVARAVGITDIIADKTDSFEGVLVTNPEKSVGRIAYRASSSVERVRFTVGHETGHFLIPTHTGELQCTPDSMLAFDGRAKAKWRESEANRFAAELLLPKRRFGRELDAYKELDLKHILELASRYGVSLEATLNRVVDLTVHACGVVFSRNGVVRYVRRHDDFPWINVNKGDALPSECRTSKHRGPTRKLTELDVVNIEEWVDEPARKFGATLLEQVFPQADGHCVTLLLLDDVDDDDD